VIGVADLSVTRGGKAVLRNVSFGVGPGEFVALVGPNGAGKTTLLSALAGLLPESGIVKPDPRSIAYVPQGARCSWGLTIRQVVALGRLPFGGRDDGGIEAAMRACGVHELADRRIDQVSGGQARRAMLARALAGSPKVLLLDEPIADLDPPACHGIMRLMARFAAGGGMVVAVLHALELAAGYATRLAVLADGAIVADGTPEQALPAAAAAFGMTLQVDHIPLLTPLA
jgi:iron complex transport system ATP-binding protein